MYPFMGQNFLIAILVVWSILWKCYSVWTAAQNHSKKWFVVLVIFNTFGILDMIYVFGVAKKKWSDIQKVLSSSK
jgi:hypothetical protein